MSKDAARGQAKRPEPEPGRGAARTERACPADTEPEKAGQATESANGDVALEPGWEPV